MSAEAFFTLYSDLPRLGPGSDACTREVLKRLTALPSAPRVVDLGCGTGRQTLVLAEALRTRLLAVDLHRPYLDQLEREARARSLDALIETRPADMGAKPTSSAATATATATCSTCCASASPERAPQHFTETDSVGTGHHHPRASPATTPTHVRQGNLRQTASAAR